MPNHDDPTAYADQLPLYVFAALVSLTLGMGLLL
jgi:hypothetical protein